MKNYFLTITISENYLQIITTMKQDTNRKGAIFPSRS